MIVVVLDVPVALPMSPTVCTKKIKIGKLAVWSTVRLLAKSQTAMRSFTPKPGISFPNE